MKKVSIVIGVILLLSASIFATQRLRTTTPLTQQPINQTNTTNPAVVPASNSARLPSNTTTNSTTTVFSLADVAQHKTAADCYLVIDNTVYDVSGYLNNHPGGRGVIQSRCGTEVTGIFARIHSNRAWNLLTSFKVGVIG